MDPAARTGRASRVGLPRTRGDGPPEEPTDARNPQASPHTRGWTRPPRSAARPAAGFPAHAGMDPVGVGDRERRRRLPRTRGDGPWGGGPPSDGTGASPHTRGWTPGHRVPEVQLGGFPAHAGMDPSISSRCRPGGWLPRTRGDGPPICGRCARRTPASPHTRGWTQSGWLCASPPDGFPAHAGMDPAAGPKDNRGGRLPRTRGDGPLTARAPGRGVRASPHTRGWTHAHHVHFVRVEGFPAHAGMDPRTALAQVYQPRI